MEVVVIMALPLPLHQQYMVNCSSRVRKVLKELTKILLESFTSLWNLAIVSSYASRMWYLSAHAISCLLDAIFYKVKHKLFFFDARLTCLIHSGFMWTFYLLLIDLSASTSIPHYCTSVATPPCQTAWNHNIGYTSSTNEATIGVIRNLKGHYLGKSMLGPPLLWSLWFLR